MRLPYTRPFTRSLTLLLLALASTRGGAQDTSAAPAKRRSTTGVITLTYLGNAGWEITDGITVVLVDPFLSQFARWDPNTPAVDEAPNRLIAPDTALINQHIKRVDYILITHGHTDHALDAGYISRRTGATIIGHETAANLARAYDVTDKNLITKSTITTTIVALPMNYIEREMIGLRPDIALAGANDQRREIYEFTPRLMRALGNPALVIPTHADSYGNPNPPPAAVASSKRFVAEVAAASPRSRVIVPKWFVPIVVPARK